MSLFLATLADGITINIGSHAWSFSTAFLIYLGIAAVIGLIAESIVGWRLPFGIVGAIIAGVVGVWLMTQVIIINGIPEINFYGVPLIRAFIGALILVLLWHMLTYRSWQNRRRYYRNRRDD